jgi:hypothetical protein
LVIFLELPAAKFHHQSTQQLLECVRVPQVSQRLPEDGVLKVKDGRSEKNKIATL